MARPKASQEGPTARERIKHAFWDLLAEKPFEQITVNDVAQAAQVNRNTFYYHFENMEALAREIIEAMIPTKFVGVLIEGITAGHIDTQLISDAGVTQEQYDRVRLAVNNESGWLFSLVREAVLDMWFERLGLGPDTFTTRDWCRINFVWNGMLGLLGTEQIGSFEEYCAALDSGIADAAATLVHAILAEHGQA